MKQSPDSREIAPDLNSDSLAIVQGAVRGDRNSDTRTALVTIHLDRANSFRKSGNPREAIEEFEQALRAIVDSDDQTRAFEAHNQTAAIYRSLGEFGPALRHFGLALAILGFLATQISAAEIQILYAESYANIGNLHREMQNYDLASQQLTKALHLYTTNDDSQGAARSLIALGAIYLDRHESERGLYYFQKAQQLYSELEQPRDVALCHVLLATAHLQLREYSHARGEIQIGLRMSEVNDAPDIRAKALLQFARLQFFEDLPIQAEETIRQLQELGRTLNDKMIFQECQSVLDEFYGGQKL